MENASKALIIAGAILLSILLISLGIMVYQNSKDIATDSSNLDTEKAQTFNNKISTYCGTSKSGTNMNNLMDAIAASNGAQKGKPTQHFVSVSVASGTEGATKTGDISVSAGATGTEYPTFDNSHTYKATYTTDDAGYINKVTVSNNS